MPTIFFLALLLVGCLRPASTQRIQAPEELPSPSLQSLNATSPSLFATPLETPAVKTMQALRLTPTTPVAASFKTPIVQGTLSAATRQTLLDFPLTTGNSWVYQHEGYSAGEQATWRIANTVEENNTHPPYYAARIQSDVTLVSGTPGSSFINPPRSRIFWYVVDGISLYRLDDPIDWSSLTSSWLELQFPFPSQGCWYPDPTQRSQSPASDLPGCRSASGPVAVDTPAGHFERCFQITTRYNSGNTLDVFCIGIGFVEGEYRHNGTEYGSHYVLTAYLLQ